MVNIIARKTCLALTAAATLLVAAPAFAGGWGEPEVIFTQEEVIVDRRDNHYPIYEDDNEYDVLSRHQIIRALRHQGYCEVREIGLRYNTYRVVAIRQNGAVVKLSVSAIDGSVLSERRIGWARSAPARIYQRPVPRYRHIEPGVSIEFGWSSN
jgi:hypothetical protein